MTLRRLSGAVILPAHLTGVSGTAGDDPSITSFAGSTTEYTAAPAVPTCSIGYEIVEPSTTAPKLQEDWAYRPYVAPKKTRSRTCSGNGCKQLPSKRVSRRRAKNKAARKSKRRNRNR